ncbi:MAG: thioredoxin family protein [Pseudomonadota bacterium]
MVDRREMLGRFRNIGLIAAGLGAGGWWIVSEVRAGIHEADLTRIGNGIPAVVQVHDPHCPTCQALQREVRAAMAPFGDDELQYLVANIRQDKGRDFQRQHDVPHVTLILFDGDGERQEILSGPNRADHLEQVFRQLAQRKAQS